MNIARALEKAARHRPDQPAILFEGARAAMQMRLALEGTAVAFAWEIVCLGRTASGEESTHGD